MGPIIWAESIFEEYLKGEGFEIVYPEELEIRQQLNIVISTDYLMGFIGSAFHSLLFSYQKPVKVIYLHRNQVKSITRIYSTIDQAKDLDVLYLDFVEDVVDKVSYIDFQGISEVLLSMGLVKHTLSHWDILYRTFLLQASYFKVMHMAPFDLTVSDLRNIVEKAKGLPGHTKLLPENLGLKDMFGKSE